MKCCVRLLMLFFLVLGCQSSENKPVSEKNTLPEKLLLHHNWEFKSVEDSVWLSASVPGNIFTDLLGHKLIPNPFIGNNEQEVQWVSEKSWEYKTRFLLEDQTLKSKNAVLNLEGLDTYASVYLNDSLILDAKNAFRQWKVDVKNILQKENTLRIVFEPTSIFENEESEKLNYTLPEGNRVFSRKAQFQYGWDWGPKLHATGIWKDIYIKSWDNAILQDTYIKQDTLVDEFANLSAHFLIHASENDEYTLDVLVNNQSVQSQKIKVNSGTQAFKIPFKIENPKRWWTHNLGEPYLYDILLLLKNKKGLTDSVSFKKGLRNIELITEKDSVGESFYFKLNGVPVYMKGANYIPQNGFQNLVTDAHYEKLLNDAVDANMNMLRVWGGGIYENDIFYEKCDEKGILIWQDFMFACAMYPGDNDFLENVQQEAIDQVKRLRNYSSIALWCGNNENSEGWHRWGWQDGRSDVEKEEIWNNYLKVFDSILPKTVNQLSDVDYWESSPKFGRGDVRYKTEGDAHDWWIWHDGHPFENLEKNVPRFMSEFGFQSFPSYGVIRYINDKDSIAISSSAFNNHQKHSRGFDIIAEYMQRDFPVPENSEDYVYVSQILQAYGIGKGIEAQRRSKPYTMGSLYWQLNDCWPAVSWSSIDFLGNWKALHYQAKRSFKNLLISSEVVNDTLQIYIVNDDLKEYKGDLKIEVIDFDGNKLQEYSQKIEVTPNSSKVYLKIPVKGYSIVANRIVFSATFQDKEALFYLVKPKDLALETSEISKTIRKVSDGFEIELSGKKLQKNVFLYTNSEGHFSDNFFDLLPNRAKIVHFRTENSEMSEVYFKVLNEFLE